MEPDEYQGVVPGFHYRPPSSADLLFNQRCVPALVVPALGYGVMAVFTPNQIGVVLWAAIALVVLPGIAGLIIHSIGDTISTRRRVVRGFVITFALFAIYGIVNMAMISYRIQDPPSGLGPLPAILLSAVGYGLVAGAVGALMASLPVHHVETHW